MKKTTLWLARHGETLWTVDDRFNGKSDIALTDIGKTQAQCLGAYLEGRSLTAIYSSPLIRCVETAHLASLPSKLSPTIQPELIELDYGIWDGMLRTDIINQYPEAWSNWTKDPAGVATPEGESGYNVLARVTPFIKELINHHIGQDILVIAHKAVNRLFLCDILGVPPRNYRKRIGQSACALNCVQWIENEPRIMLMNSVMHYRRIP